MSPFPSEEDFDSLAATAEPEENRAEEDAAGPTYICEACKADVMLTDYKPGVYGYTCAECGHEGVKPKYDYQLWLERTKNNGR